MFVYSYIFSPPLWRFIKVRWRLHTCIKSKPKLCIFIWHGHFKGLWWIHQYVKSTKLVPKGTFIHLGSFIHFSCYGSWNLTKVFYCPPHSNNIKRSFFIHFSFSLLFALFLLALGLGSLRHEFGGLHIGVFSHGRGQTCEPEQEWAREAQEWRWSPSSPKTYAAVERARLHQIPGLFSFQHEVPNRAPNEPF